MNKAAMKILISDFVAVFLKDKDIVLDAFDTQHVTFTAIISARGQKYENLVNLGPFLAIMAFLTNYDIS